MKNEKNKSKIFNILIIIFVFLVIFGTIILKGTTDLDEIWNYNFAKNIAEGRIPYKDFNMIQTPLLAMICAVFLKIFGNELIVMRILAGILLTIIFFISYKILNKLLGGKNWQVSLTVIFLLIFSFMNIFAIDYNYAVLLIALILTLVELSRLEKEENILSFSFKYDFLIGLIAGIGILFKQSTGLIVAIVCIGYKIFAIRKKEDIIEFIKIALIRSLGIIIPCLIFLIYLICTNSLSDFIDYAILGISTFSNSKSYKNLFEETWYVKVLAVLVPIAILCMFIRIFIGKKDNNILILFAYSISSFTVVYPIADKVHFMIGSLITIIGMLYLLKDLLSRFDLKINAKCITWLFIWAFVTLLITTIVNMYNYIVSSKTELTHFNYIPNEEEMIESIMEIDKYITQKNEEGYEVYILDFQAAIYMIPLDKYNKNYDMFLKGNLGSNGEQGIIDNLETENVIYLIRNDNYANNWQTPYTVLNYIKENFTKTDEEVYIFDVYVK